MKALIATPVEFAVRQRGKYTEEFDSLPKDGSKGFVVTKDELARYESARGNYQSLHPRAKISFRKLKGDKPLWFVARIA